MYYHPLEQQENSNQLSDFQYMATYPYSKNTWEWTKIILARILFPPLILWDALKWITTTLFGYILGRFVLLAQQDQNVKSYTMTDKQLSHQLSSHKQITYKRGFIETYHGARLDTLEITPAISEEKESAQSQKYIIKFNGNGYCYEQILDEMISDSKALNCSVVGFNYRGVNDSTGTPSSQYDLVEDGIVQVQRLIDQGIPAADILLDGRSLGGAVATLVAKNFHDRGYLINVFNDRSFSNITNFVVGHIRSINTIPHPQGHTDSWRGAILGYLLKPFIKLFLILSQWEMEASSAFQEIPQENREYFYIRSSKKDRTTHHNLPDNVYKIPLCDDYIIRHYASLAATLKQERREERSDKYNVEQKLDDIYNDPSQKRKMVRNRTNLFF